MIAIWITLTHTRVTNSLIHELHIHSILSTAGMIPGVIYGWNETEKQVSIRVMVPVKPLNKVIRETKHSFECTVQTLRLDDDSKYLVTPRQLQVDPRE